MKRVQVALLSLLRGGLWERGIDDLSCFSLSADEWEGVFRLSRQQTVTGIVFRGLQFLPDDMLPGESLLLRWTATVDSIEHRNREMNRAVAELYALFRQCRLEPVLQKGQGVAQYYESPLLRECGDIDLYFSDSHACEVAATCLRQNGIRLKRKPDGSLFYYWKGMEVEHHRQLLDLYNPFLKSHACKLEVQQGYAAMTLPDEGAGISVSIPSPLLYLLMLDLHILKHVLGRGIGLRQLCDMARACHRLCGDVSRDEMKAACLKLGLGRWNPLLHAFMTDFLGMPESSLPYPERARDAYPLLEIVWRGGNFGQYVHGHTPAGESPVWKRKVLTAQSFWKNLGFTARYAPKEAFWIFTDLLKGQIR